MPATVSCTWCGNEVELPPGCGLNIECPKCKSMCGVPAHLVVAAAKAEKPPAPPPLPPVLEEEVLDEEELVFLDEPEPAPIPTTSRRNPPELPARPAQKEEELEFLDEAEPVPLPTTSRRNPPQPPPRPVDDDEDDGKPYVLGTPIKRCPHCGAILEDDAVACIKCKYDLKTKQIPVPTYTPLKRSWESGWPFATRMRAFILYESGLIILAVVFSWWGSFSVALVPFLFLSATLAFIMGTYDRVDVTRSAKGKISLSKTWRFCFVEQTPKRLALGDYESMTTSMLDEREFIDTAIVLWLLFCGILPGVLWYIFVYNRPNFQLALCTGHGCAAYILYRGKDEAHMREIAVTVSEVCQFPLGS